MTNTSNIDFLREGSIIFATSVVDKVLAFLVFIYFARYFDPTAFGAAYAVIGASVAISGLPLAFCVAIKKRVSESPSTYPVYFTLGLVVVTAFAGACYLALTGLLNAVDSVPYAYLALAGVVHLFGRSYLYLIQRVYEGVGDIGRGAGVIELFDGLVTIVAKFGLILGVGMGVEGLLYGSAIAAVAVGTVFYTLDFTTRIAKPSWAHIMSVGSFFKWKFLSRAARTAYNNSETALVGFLIGPVAASHFKSAKILPEPGRFPTASLTPNVFVEASGRSSTGQDVAESIRKGTRYTGILAIPIFIGALILGDDLMVTVFGPNYSGTGYILIATAAAFVCKAFSNVFRAGTDGANQPQLVATISVVQLVVFLPLYIWTLYTSQFVFFLSLVVACYVTECLAYFIVLRRWVVDSPILDWAFLGRQATAGLVMGGGVSLLNQHVAVTSVFDLGVLVGTGGVLYILCLTAISTRFRQVLRTSTTLVQRWWLSAEPSSSTSER